METIVEVYRHVGVKVRIDLSRRGLPASRMTILNSRFDEIDTTTNAVHSDEVPLHPLPLSQFTHLTLTPPFITPSSYPHPSPHHTLIPSLITPSLITPLFPLSSPPPSSHPPSSPPPSSHLTLGGGL